MFFDDKFSFFNLKLVIDDYDLINYIIANQNDKFYSQSNGILLLYFFCYDFNDIKKK